MDDEAGPRFDYLRFARRVIANRWLIVLAGILGIALPAAVWAVVFTPSVYEATATVFLDRPKPESGFLRDYVPVEADTLYLAILRSRSLAQGVTDALPRESLAELQEAMGGQDYLLALQNAIRSRLGYPVIVYSPRERAVIEVQRSRMSFSVSRDGTVTVTAAAYNPRVATDLANTYVDLLLLRSGTYAREQGRLTRELIEGLLAQTRTLLGEAEEAYRKFQAETGAPVRIPEQSSLEITRLAQAENALVELQVNKEIAQAKLAYLRGDPQKTGTAAGPPIDPAVQHLRARIMELEAQAAALSERYTEQHPLMVAARASIDEAQERLKLALEGRQVPRPGGIASVPPSEKAALARQMADLEVELASLQARESALQQRVAVLKRSLSTLTAREQEHATLARAMESHRSLFNTLSERLTAARIHEQGQIRGIRIIDQATVPQAPSSRPLAKKIALSLILGLGLGAGLAGLLEFRHDVVETEDDVTGATGLPVLGAIPTVPAESSRANHDGAPVNLLDRAAPDSLPAEACRTIRTSLEFQDAGRPLRTLLVTSPGAGEGKTTVLLNLALAFRETGRRVLLVDADLRRPSLHRAFELPNRTGLADLLRGHAAWDDACRPVRDGLASIPSGIERANPNALLSSRRTAPVVQAATERADLVLIDSTPVLAVSDNHALSPLVDGVVLVVRSGRTRRRSLVRAKLHLERLHARVLGVVINGLSPRETRRYYPEYAGYVSGNGPHGPSPRRRGERPTQGSQERPHGH